MIPRRIATTLVTVWLLGCQLPAPKGPEIVALKVGESAAFAEFTLTFVGVENESRCPKQVECVWAGNAVVAVTAVTPHPGIGIAAAKQFLNTSIDPRSLKAGTATLVLDSLTPSPISEISIPQESYTAWFSVTRP